MDLPKRQGSTAIKVTHEDEDPKYKSRASHDSKGSPTQMTVHEDLEITTDFSKRSRGTALPVKRADLFVRGSPTFSNGHEELLHNFKAQPFAFPGRSALMHQRQYVTTTHNSKRHRTMLDAGVMAQGNTMSPKGAKLQPMQTSHGARNKQLDPSMDDLAGGATQWNAFESSDVDDDELY